MADVLVAGEEASFFANHHRRMHYLEMRAATWLFGSGTVENAAKPFKARFSGPGMRGAHTGAQNLRPMRAAVLSNRFDDRWAATQYLPPSLSYTPLESST